MMYKCARCGITDCSTYVAKESYPDEAWGTVQIITNSYIVSSCCGADVDEHFESDEDQEDDD